MRAHSLKRSQGRPFTAWIFVLVLLCVLAITSSALGAESLERRPSGYALAAARDGSVYYFGATGSRIQLLRTSFGGKTRVVKISQLTKSGPDPQAITLGGDGRIWASVYDKNNRRTSIYRVSSGKVESRILLPRGHFASAMATDSGGRTWLLGRRDGRLDFVTRKAKLHGVRVAESAKLDGITRGLHGDVWAVGKKIVLRISTKGVRRSIGVRTTASAEIESANGDVWVTASGGLQRINQQGAEFLPLQSPRVKESSGNSHAYFVSDNRMSLSLFTRPDGDLGFTAGAVLSAPEDEFMIADNSVGRVDESGAVTEAMPWGSFGPYFGALTDLDRADGRSPGAKAATVDSSGNLWLKELTEVTGYQSGTW